MTLSAAEIFAEQRAQLGMLQGLGPTKCQEIVAQAAPLIARWPDFAPFHVVRARALAGLRDYDGAILGFQKALALKPADKQSAEALAACLRKTGRTDEAIPYYKALYGGNPNPYTATDLMRAAFDASQEDRPLMEKLLKELYPAHFSAHPQQEIVMSPYVPFGEWCANNRITASVVDSGGERRLTGVDGAPVEPYVSPPTQFSTLRNASVISGLDWVISPNGEFLDGSGLALFQMMGPLPMGGRTFVPYAPDTVHGRVLHARSRDEIFIDEDVVFLSAYRKHHYGHWIYDYLPRLMAWKRPLKLFIYASLPRAQRETLMRFGVKRADVIEGAEDGQVYRFKSITMLHRGDTERPTPVVAKFLHRALAAKQDPLPKGAAGGRFFLERSRTDRGRNIANAAELQAVLDEFEIETIRRPDLTVAQQDEKFSGAELVISPFGSDVITYFQLRPGTDFVVLNFENMEAIYPGIEPIARRYCAILGMPYHNIACGLVEREGKMEYHGDMRVDCDALRRTLAAIMARRG